MVNLSTCSCSCPLSMHDETHFGHFPHGCQMVDDTVILTIVVYSNVRITVELFCIQKVLVENIGLAFAGRIATRK